MAMQPFGNDPTSDDNNVSSGVIHSPVSAYYVAGKGVGFAAIARKSGARNRAWREQQEYKKAILAYPDRIKVLHDAYHNSAEFQEQYTSVEAFVAHWMDRSESFKGYSKAFEKYLPGLYETMKKGVDAKVLAKLEARYKEQVTAQEKKRAKLQRQTAQDIDWTEPQKQHDLMAFILLNNFAPGDLMHMGQAYREERKAQERLTRQQAKQNQQEKETKKTKSSIRLNDVETDLHDTIQRTKTWLTNSTDYTNVKYDVDTQGMIDSMPPNDFKWWYLPENQDTTGQSTRWVLTQDLENMKTPVSIEIQRLLVEEHKKDSASRQDPWRTAGKYLAKQTLPAGKLAAAATKIAAVHTANFGLSFGIATGAAAFYTAKESVAIVGAMADMNKSHQTFRADNQVHQQALKYVELQNKVSENSLGGSNPYANLSIQEKNQFIRYARKFGDIDANTYVNLMSQAALKNEADKAQKRYTQLQGLTDGTTGTVKKGAQIANYVPTDPGDVVATLAMVGINATSDGLAATLGFVSADVLTFLQKEAEFNMLEAQYFAKVKDPNLPERERNILKAQLGTKRALVQKAGVALRKENLKRKLPDLVSETALGYRDGNEIRNRTDIVQSTDYLDETNNKKTLNKARVKQSGLQSGRQRGASVNQTVVQNKLDQERNRSTSVDGQPTIERHETLSEVMDDVALAGQRMKNKVQQPTTIDRPNAASMKGTANNTQQSAYMAKGPEHRRPIDSDASVAEKARLQIETMKREQLKQEKLREQQNQQNRNNNPNIK